METWALDSSLVYYQRALAEAEHVGNPKIEAESLCMN